MKWTLILLVSRWSTIPAVVNAFYSSTKNQISESATLIEIVLSYSFPTLSFPLSLPPSHFISVCLSLSNSSSHSIFLPFSRSLPLYFCLSVSVSLTLALSLCPSLPFCLSVTAFFCVCRPVSLSGQFSLAGDGDKDGSFVHWLVMGTKVDPQRE